MRGEGAVVAAGTEHGVGGAARAVLPGAGGARGPRRSEGGRKWRAAEVALPGGGDVGGNGARG
ncbi:hypothetical protein ACFWN2_15295 [Lentzea sp. NPDC058436]|uniref:hypothetical protein n=1 Tax=Lentzea sp. NPDC058436 TaxID=3346499 RepID=UPI00365BA45D